MKKGIRANTSYEPKLGDFARDKATGWYGVITKHIRQLSGPERFFLQPPVNGGWIPGRWFDAERLEKDKGPHLIGFRSQGK